MSRQRDEDLMRAYHQKMDEAMKSEGRFNKMDIITRAVNSPASRYWISLERACLVIYKLKRGEPITGAKNNSRRLYESIYQKYLQAERQYPDTPVKHLIANIIEQPAPCFALTAQSASLLINKIRKKQWYKERRRLLRRLF
jgi:hypothetical protein